MTTEQLTDIFSYYAPTESQRVKYEEVNKIFLDAILKLDLLMPEGPGKTVAIRKLSESRMQVNAAIALEGRF